MTRRKYIPLETRFLKQSKLFFKKGARILLAVSGGVDSMAMARLFKSVKDPLHLDIGIAHVNHGLRGKRAETDASFVKHFSEQAEWPFYGTKVNVRRASKEYRWSKEEAGRYLRYQYLDEIVRREKYDWVCTAHHQSDQAETVLMRLVKGTGWRGLCGIRERRGKYVRPMLHFSKEEILTYARKSKLKFVDDASNVDLKFLRNRIRRQVLPVIKATLDPQAEKHLARLAAIAEDTHRFLRSEAGRLFDSVCRADDAKIVLEIKPFNKYLLIQRQALIELIFEKLSIDGKPDLEYDDFTRIIDFIGFTQSGKKLTFNLIECVKQSDRVVFRKKRFKELFGFSYGIECNESYRWPELKMRFSSETVSPANIRFSESKFTEYIDVAKISGRLVLRNWKPGDCFFPLGMNRSKKLSDFFIDEKIALDKKAGVPILCDRSAHGETIVWIGGCRLDDRYKITPATKHVLRLECHWNERN